jgi:hypothetical protein
MEILRKYGVATHIYIPIVKRAVVDFAVSADWTPAAGDVKISKDGGAAANVTNLPTAITMGNTAMWDFSMTATEMQAAKIMVTVADSATKAVEDQMFIIGTYGNASAEHAVDLDDSVRAGLTALPNAAAEAAGGLYTRGSGAGQINQNANGQIDSRTVTMANDVVTAAAVANAAIDAATFAAGAIDAAAIAADAIGSSEFAQAAADKVWASAARSLTDKAGFALAAAEYTALVNLMWDELTSEGRTAGSFGQLLKDNLNAAVSSRAIPGDAMDLVVNAVDALALASDAVDEIWNRTLTELAQAQPAATPSAANALMLLYMMARNASKSTSSERRVLNDAGTVIIKAPMSDDGTTFDQGKMVAGP